MNDDPKNRDRVSNEGTTISTAVTGAAQLAASEPPPSAYPFAPQRSLIETVLDDDQADDVVLINLEGKSSIADMLVIASGRNARHVGAMAEHLREKLRAAGFGEPSIEGAPQCDWVLVDAGDMIVHLFRPEVRAFYNIEKMWGVEGPLRAVPASPSFLDA